jgi:FeS assembly SUF system protein
MFSIFGRRNRPVDPAAGAAGDTLDAPSPAVGPAVEPDVAAPGETPMSGADAGHATSLDVGALLKPPAESQPVAFGPVDPERTDVLKPAIVEAISTVFDPEIPVNIYELGLIYEIAADAASRVCVRMTLTSPACPSAQQLPSEVRYKVKAIDGVSDCTVDVVWEPPWTKDMMSEAARLSLGMF